MNSLKQYPQSCPLCAGRQIGLHRWFDVDGLKNDWQKGFGFEPFSRLGIAGVAHQFRCFDCDLRFFDPATELAGDGVFYNELSSRFPWYYEKNKWEFDVAAEILAGLDGIKRVLEVGCGQGHFLVRIKNRYEVKGLEFNPQAIADCKDIGLDVTSDAMATLDEGIFDVVSAFEVLEHLPAPREFIEQSLRLLRPGGYLLFAVPDPEGYFTEAEKVLLDMPPHHVMGFTKKAFKNMEALFSLKVEQIHQEPLRFAHYRSYLGNFLAPPPPPRKPSFFDRVLYRLFGYQNERDVELKRLGEKIAEVQMATSFHSAKDKLVGQTHLILLQKR